MHTVLPFKLLSMLSFMCFISSCNTTQKIDNELLLSVDMEMATRGNSSKIHYEKNQITKENKQLSEVAGEKIRQRISSEWDELNRLVSKLNLAEFENWEAPTQKRFYDGARGTTIKLNFADKTLSSQTFDEGEPPAELSELYDYLVSVLNQ